MPFSLSHPIAVVPLAKTSLPFSALVIGAMSPDFEYLLRLKQNSHESHTIWGVIRFCLPASLAMLVLWHCLLKHPLTELLPEQHRAALHPYLRRFTFGPSKQFALTCVACLLGAATHVLWDSFTHPWGWPVQQYPLFQLRVMHIAGQEIVLYKLLQYGSSFVGLAALFLCYRQWLKRQPLDTPAPSSALTGHQRMRLWIALLLMAALPTVGYVRFVFPPTQDLDNFKAFVVRSIIVGMAVLLWELILYSVWFRFWATRETQSEV